MQFDRVRLASEEGVFGLERVDDFQCVEELAELRVGFPFHVPETFPHDFDVITSLSQGLLFLDRGYAWYDHCDRWDVCLDGEESIRGTRAIDIRGTRTRWVDW